jgi:glycosyltransferase involved in cell wall biosynthesis
MKDVFYFNTWYRGHNNARYAELLPRLERVRSYLLTFPAPRLARAVAERGWRAVRPAAESAVVRSLERRHPYAFVTDLAQLGRIRVPSLVDVDDIDLDAQSAEMWRRSTMVAYTVTAERTARRLEELGVDRPWYVVPQGAALDARNEDDVRRVAALREPGTVVVGYVAAFLLVSGDRGGHDPLYNVEHLLSLWDEIAARVPEARLWLVGHASPRLRARLAGRADVRLFGHVGRERLASAIANFDVALYPRTEDTGIRASKVAEYLGAGVPIVSYDFAVVDDVREAGAGLLVDSGREFAEAVERVVRDGGLRAQLATAARAEGERRDWRRLAAQVADILDRHLPRH